MLSRLCNKQPLEVTLSCKRRPTHPYLHLRAETPNLMLWIGSIDPINGLLKLKNITKLKQMRTEKTLFLAQKNDSNGFGIILWLSGCRKNFGVDADFMRCLWIWGAVTLCENSELLSAFQVIYFRLPFFCEAPLIYLSLRSTKVPYQFLATIGLSTSITLTK